MLWCPIDLADKSVSRLLLVCPQFSTLPGEEPYIGVGHYVPMDPPHEGFWMVETSQTGAERCEPSHFMSLPEPP